MCMSIVRDVCTKLNIRGNGEASYMTTHGLRATMISMLISAGYSDAAVVLRSGHRDSTSLQSYHNLRGVNGERQLGAVFGEASQAYKNTSDVTNNGESLKRREKEDIVPQMLKQSRLSHPNTRIEQVEDGKLELSGNAGQTFRLPVALSI